MPDLGQQVEALAILTTAVADADPAGTREMAETAIRTARLETNDERRCEALGWAAVAWRPLDDGCAQELLEEAIGTALSSGEDLVSGSALHSVLHAVRWFNVDAALTVIRRKPALGSWGEKAASELAGQLARHNPGRAVRVAAGIPDHSRTNALVDVVHSAAASGDVGGVLTDALDALPRSEDSLWLLSGLALGLREADPEAACAVAREVAMAIRSD